VLSLEFRLLGPVEAWTADAPIGLGHARQRAVLAALLLYPNRLASIDQLIDRVWGETPPASARETLYGYVSSLRRRLRAVSAGQASIVHRGGYAIETDPALVDLHQFRALVEQARTVSGAEKAVLLGDAVRLWQGVPLADVESPWLSRMRQGLQGEYSAAVLAYSEVEITLGRHADVVDLLRETVVASPHDERLVGQLLQALYALGQPARALEVYEQTRRLLADDLGISPSLELRDLHQRILRDDVSLNDLSLSRRQAVRRVPRELPHDVRGFRGRDTELAYLERMAAGGRSSGGSATICAIDGTAGVGKTALAIHFAHRVADRFPDGQLYVNLRGFDPCDSPLSADDVLDQFLRSLGINPEQIPAVLDERTRLYRSVLADRRILLLLDNAATAEQVRPLLPGSSTCLALVTSRRRLSGLLARDGAQPLTVDVLTRAEAVTLIGAIAGADGVAAEPGATEELARLAGHLPLALRIIAERHAGRKHWKIQDLVDELAGERDRLDVLAAGDDDQMAVRAAFSWSYRDLLPDAARLFRLLSLHAGGDFSTHAAAALADTTLGQARHLLDVLCAANLLEQNARDRYRFPVLLRVYATERADDEETEQERAAAVRRELTWYLHTVDAGARIVTPGSPHLPLEPPAPSRQPLVFTRHTSAMQWYETERDNLVSAIRQAADLGEDLVAWQLPKILLGFFYLRKHRADWIVTHQIGLDTARRLNDPLAEAWMLIGLGVAYQEIGRFNEALTQHRLGLALWRQIDDQRGEALSLANVGITFLGLRNPLRAVEYCQRALALARQIADPWCEGGALVFLSLVNRHLRHYPEALDYSRRALRVWYAIGDLYGQAWCLNSLGTVHRCLGHFDEAVNSSQRALAIRREIGDRKGEAASLNSLGKALYAAGRPDQARDAWLHALKVFEDLGDPKTNAIKAQLEGIDTTRTGHLRSSTHQYPVEVGPAVSTKRDNALTSNGSAAWNTSTEAHVQ
jgi:DNA-binding SARP family transcriptional activator/Flp pilus assembly protein TadD